MDHFFAEKWITFLAGQHRISLDFRGAGLALERKRRHVGVGAVRDVTALVARGRLRVVVSLVRLVPHETRIRGRSVLLLLDNARLSAAPAAAPARVEDVVLRVDGQAGRILVRLSEPWRPVRMRREGNAVVLDLPWFPKRVQGTRLVELPVLVQTAARAQRAQLQHSHPRPALPARDRARVYAEELAQVTAGEAPVEPHPI